MKKAFILDKVNFRIIILNIIGFLITFVFRNTLYHLENVFDVVVAILITYTIFGIPLVILISMVLNIISIVKKKKQDIDIKINLVLFIVLILNIPIWYKFFWLALMSV